MVFGWVSSCGHDTPLCGAYTLDAIDSGHPAGRECVECVRLEHCVGQKEVVVGVVFCDRDFGTELAADRGG